MKEILFTNCTHPGLSKTCDYCKNGYEGWQNNISVIDENNTKSMSHAMK